MNSDKEREKYLKELVDAASDAIAGRNYKIRAKALANLVCFISSAKYANNNVDFAITVSTPLMMAHAYTRSKRNLSIGVAEFQAAVKGHFREIDEKEKALDVSPKEVVLDLSDYGENLNITADQFSELLHKKDLPADFKAVLDSFCAEVKQ